MPDTYVTISDKKGTVNISEDVIAAIAGNAITEVEEVSVFSNTNGTELGELIGKKAICKGIHVSLEEKSICIDLTVMVRFGQKISSVAEKAQHTVSAAVESMTGLVPVVNVLVAGISFDK